MKPYETLDNEIESTLNELESLLNSNCIDDGQYKQLDYILHGLQPWERNFYVAYRMAPQKKAFFESLGLAYSTAKHYIKQIKEKINEHV